MGVVESVTEVVAPVVASLGVELVDVEHGGGVVRLVVDEPGGIGLDRIAEVTRAASRALDAADPIPGQYTLEVSSPGLERPLRTPTHFARAVGQQVAVRTRAGFAGERRVAGALVDADEVRVVVRTEGGDVEIPHSEIDRARTVVDWTPPPKPGKGGRKTPRGAGAAKGHGGSGGQAASAAAVAGRRDEGHEGQELG